MNLHEYQSKQLFTDYGIPIPAGRAARTAEDAGRIATELGGNCWVVKAQVHAGGRGKAGGVSLVRSVAEVAGAAESLLGGRLVTHQRFGRAHRVTRSDLVPDRQLDFAVFYRSMASLVPGSQRPVQR